MATINAAASSLGLDYQQYAYMNWPGHNDPDNISTSGATQSPNSFTENSTGGFRFEYTGTFANYQRDPEDGLTYPEQANVSGISIFLNDALISSIQGLSWNAGNSNNVPVDDHRGWLAGDDTITGSSSNDQIAGFAGNDVINGGGGIDTAVYSGTGTVTRNGDTFTVAAGNDGTDTLTNVERIQFANKKIALDVDNNATETMQFIGTIAPKFQGYLAVRGMILDFFDQGHTLESLSQLAIQAGLVPTANGDLASQIIRNVLPGVSGTSFDDLKSACTAYIDEHGQAKFIADVAALSLNVNLVGIHHNGMEYL